MATSTRGGAPQAPAALPWTGGDDEADRLIAGDPTALLIGFLLDQQVTVQKAFSGPLEIRRRLGTVDAALLSRMDPDRVAAAFATPPAIHRFPRSMAARTQRLCARLVEDYGGHTEALWQTAADAGELRRRLSALPGIGPAKATTIITLLARQYGVRPPGWEQAVATHPSLGEVTTPEELERYQAGKRAHKAELRASGALPARRGTTGRR